MQFEFNLNVFKWNINSLLVGHKVELGHFNEKVGQCDYI